MRGGQSDGETARTSTSHPTSLCSAQIPPTAEEAGHSDIVEVQEIGDTNVVIFRQGTDNVNCVL